MRILLFVSCVAVYWNTLGAPFTFDDERAIVVNEQIRHVSTSLGPTEPGSPLGGRPLVSLTFALNYAVGALDVRGYRLVNIALHAWCGVLLFALVRQTARRRDAPGAEALAFAAASIWMLHPLTTEAVDYVSQRTELMMAAFFLLTVQQGASRPARPVVSVACCALGMACKETMVVAPVMVWLYDRTFISGSFAAALRARPVYYAGLCSTWLVLAALLWSAPRGDSAGFAGAAVSPWVYLLNQSMMIARYLRLAVWPRGLVLDYGEPVRLTLASVWPYAAAVFAFVIATAIALVRRPIAGFLGAWFFLTLAPTSSIVPISTEVGAERRMYLPLMALAAGLVILVQRRTRAPAHRRTPETATVVLVVIAALLAVATVQRNAEYRSGITLWQSVLDRWPPHARAHRNLAAELKLAGRSDEEIVQLRAAVADLPEIRNLLGMELLALGRNDEAARQLQEYSRSHPRDADALSSLGIAFAALGRDDDATTAFTRAVAANPANGLSQRNLALHLLQRNDFDGAVRHASEAARLTPVDPQAHNLLGLALAGQGRLNDAIAEFRASLALQPSNNDAAGYLERTLSVAGR